MSASMIADTIAMSTNSATGDATAKPDQPERSKKMDNNRYLKEAIISESARGGQAYYRAKHHGANPQSVHLADFGELQKAKAHRVLRVKLFAIPAIHIRLPRWALIGRLSA